MKIQNQKVQLNKGKKIIYFFSFENFLINSSMEFKKDLKREVTVVDASDYSIKRGDKKDYKTFMSHKISKVVEGERKKPEGNKRRRNQEEQEEDLNDKELASILEMQKKIEELNNKDLVGKERLEYQKKKLIGMGLDKISKTRVPRDAFYGIQNKKEKRAKKEIEEVSVNILIIFKS